MIARQFKRTYFVPDTTRYEDVSSNLSADGVLVVKCVKGRPRNEILIRMLTSDRIA